MTADAQGAARLNVLRGSIAWLHGLALSVRPVRCCDCRLERDEALVELARLRERLRELG